MSMQPSFVFASLMLCALPSLAAPNYVEPDPEATRSVSVYLASKDCPGAVKALNAGVQAKQRDVLLLAGAMFETGLCVKEDWARAAYFYRLADEAGSAAALHRLAAGYAVAGRDNALALWWAAQRPGALPPACIPAADPVREGDAFASALEKMPASLFKGCVYITGVYSALLGETEFPESARQYGVYGDVGMEFDPAQGTIAWSQGSTDQSAVGLINGTKLAAEGRRVGDSLIEHMRTMGKRSLARYQKPEGIDPAVRIRQTWSFAYRL